jgi:hypothetical protein
MDKKDLEGITIPVADGTPDGFLVPPEIESHIKPVLVDDRLDVVISKKALRDLIDKNLTTEKIIEMKIELDLKPTVTYTGRRINIESDGSGFGSIIEIDGVKQSRITYFKLECASPREIVTFTTIQTDVGERRKS